MALVYPTSLFSVVLVHSFLFKVGFFYSLGVCTGHPTGMAQCTVWKFSEDACWRFVSPGNKVKSP